MEPPKFTLGPQHRKRAAVKIGGGGAVLLLGGALATAAFVSSFLNRRKKGKGGDEDSHLTEIDGGDQRLELGVDDDPSVKEIEVDDGVCTEEVRSEMNGVKVVEEKEELDEIEVEDDEVGVREVGEKIEGEGIRNNDEKEKQYLVDESVKEAVESIEIDGHEYLADESVKEAVENIEIDDEKEKQSHEDRVDESIKQEVDLVEKGINCNELPPVKQHHHLSCEDNTNTNTTSTEIEHDSISSPKKQDFEVNQKESSLLLGFAVHQEGVKADVDDDQTTCCDNQEKLDSFEEPLQEVEGKVEEDAVIKEAKKETKQEYYNFKSKYGGKPSRRAVAIGAFSVLSSLSCSWFFGLSFLNLCLVLFFAMALSKKIHAHY